MVRSTCGAAGILSLVYRPTPCALAPDGGAPSTWLRGLPGSRVWTDRSGLPAPDLPVPRTAGAAPRMHDQPPGYGVPESGLSRRWDRYSSLLQPLNLLLMEHEFRCPARFSLRTFSLQVRVGGVAAGRCPRYLGGKDRPGPPP